MKKITDIVIIGGGIIGTSIAYHLGKSGVKNVILLEKNLIGSGSTGKAAGLTIHQWNTELDVRLVMGSLEIYKELIQEAKKELFNQSGLVYLAMNDTEEKYLHQSELLLKEYGARADWIDSKDMHRYLGWMNTDDFKCGLYTPDDGYMDPYQIAYGFVQAARRDGIKVNEMSGVIGVELSQDRIKTVKTVEGDIPTRTVINASGCWAKEIGNMMGLKLPLKPYRTQIAVLKPPALLPAEMPAVYDMNRNVYFHGETGGLLLVGDGTTEKEENPDMFKQKVDSNFLEDIAKKVSYLIPHMSDAKVVNSWAGLCTATPDRIPIIGPVPNVKGLILANGSNGYGFMRAGMIGKLVAQIVIGNKPSIDVSTMLLDRFAGRDVSDFVIKQGMIS
ncbi:MAG: FAD-binding oxidoreductase [Planctomycetota bacterium]